MADNSKMHVRGNGEAQERGHLIELDEWTEEQAIAMARQDGLELSDDHLAVIRYLRDCYADHGGTITAHVLTHTLEEEFAGLGGHKHLSKLFPLGLIAQATRYAGLPVPPGTRDQTFSITH